MDEEYKNMEIEKNREIDRLIADNE